MRLNFNVAKLSTAGVFDMREIKTLDDLIGMKLRDVEEWAILRTLEVTGGNRKDTAKALGISLKTLYRKLDEYQPSDFRAVCRAELAKLKNDATN